MVTLALSGRPTKLRSPDFFAVHGDAAWQGIGTFSIKRRFTCIAQLNQPRDLAALRFAIGPIVAR